MHDLEKKMLERAVHYQVDRLRELGRDRSTSRAAFEKIMLGTTTTIEGLFGRTPVGARAVERSNGEFMPEALRLFDQYWPAEITV